jgi:hypothetical protein
LVRWSSFPGYVIALLSVSMAGRLRLTVLASYARSNPTSQLTQNSDNPALADECRGGFRAGVSPRRAGGG